MQSTGRSTNRANRANRAEAHECQPAVQPAVCSFCYQKARKKTMPPNSTDPQSCSDSLSLQEEHTHPRRRQQRHVLAGNKAGPVTDQEADVGRVKRSCGAPQQCEDAIPRNRCSFFPRNRVQHQTTKSLFPHGTWHETIRCY